MKSFARALVAFGLCFPISVHAQEDDVIGSADTAQTEVAQTGDDTEAIIDETSEDASKETTVPETSEALDTQSSTASADAIAYAPGEKNDYKFYFFSKQGVSQETFIDDYEFCSEYGSRVKPPPGGYVYAPNPIAAGAAGIFQGLEKSKQRNRMFWSVMRKCMSIKGYARFALDKDGMKELWDGGWDDAKTRIALRAAQPITNERRVVP